MIIWEDRGFLLLASVVCVNKMGSLWIICCCILLWLERYGHFVFCQFGVQWVMLKRVVGLMMCWNWWDTKNFIGVIWNAIPLCITWIIQKEYNNRTFEGLEHSLANVKLSLLCAFYTWVAPLSGHSVCIWHWLKKPAFFYYLTYFCNYSWVLLHFLVLFMSPTVLFQLPFSFIYSIFIKKFLVSAK